MTLHRHCRRGFTLLELLVVMTIIIALAAMTIMVSTYALDRDRSATAVNQLQGAAQIARSRAYRDGLPHGIRLINNGAQQAITFQYIQSPAVFVPNFPGGAADPTRYVQFEYPVDAGGQVPGTGAPPNNQRQCRIFGLTADQQTRVVPGAILQLPELGTWHRISDVTPGNPMIVVLNDPSLQFGYPDDQLGAATHLRTYYFGLYEPPQAVIGEEVQQLPQEVVVDLRAGFSSPSAVAGADYDILFAPSGKLVGGVNSPNTAASGHVFLWVHDPARGNPNAPDVANGGEQLLFVVKAQSGAVGGAPVDHAGASGGDYYALARKAVAGH